jgi:hypothetical protein
LHNLKQVDFYISIIISAAIISKVIKDNGENVVRGLSDISHGLNNIEN